MTTDRWSTSSRRDFFRFSAAWLALTAKRAAGGSSAQSENAGAATTLRIPVMPPGAGTRARFSARCTACHLCVARCPTQILRPAIGEYGWTGFLQPRMDFHRCACDPDCRACMQVCPTHALQPLSLEDKRRVRVGMAELKWKLCVVRTERRACGDCARVCPTGAMVLRGWHPGLDRPLLRPDLCTGCGACEAVCPARPDRAIRIQGLERQEQADPADPR